MLVGRLVVCHQRVGIELHERRKAAPDFAHEPGTRGEFQRTFLLSRYLGCDRIGAADRRCDNDFAHPRRCRWPRAYLNWHGHHLPGRPAQSHTPALAGAREMADEISFGT